MSNKVLKATVKATGEKIEVYRLESGKYNLFLGDKISTAAIDKKEHMRVFNADDLHVVTN